MAPNLPGLRKKLNYPLYAADFDPLNQDFLLVGGGGGSTSSGVPNKITLIDTSRTDALSEITDIILSKDEDSVTTLAVSTSSDTSLTAIAGINSSVADQNAGKNEHLRAFRIPLPGRKRRADGTTVETHEKPTATIGTQALGRMALFKSARGPKSDTYQRVLRASSIKSANEIRMAAVASGLAPENEVIAFQPVSNARTSTVDVISRISLGDKEAADVDVIAANENGHVLAYCTDDEVFVQQLHSSKETQIQQPNSIYKTLHSQVAQISAKSPKFRALRLLTPRHILLLQNQPQKTGVSLLILRVNQDYSQGQITLQKKLSKSMKTAVGLDICTLTESETGEKQTIIAAAGQDSSVELLTIDYSPKSGFRTFKPYTILRNLHSGPMTRIVFSNFIGPLLPVDKDVRPQSVRLASVGVDQTIIVHYLPLRPYPAVYSNRPRYVLVPPGSTEATQTAFSVFIALVVVTIAAILMQAFCEIRGAVPPRLGATNWLSPSLQSKIARPYIFSSSIPTAVSDIPALSTAIEKIKSAPSSIPTIIPLDASNMNLEDLVSQHGSPNSDSDNNVAIIIRDQGPGEVSTELHPDADQIEHEDKQTLKKWEQLSEKEKKGWKKKLKAAGTWAEHQGESILQGILFSELAGVVGALGRGG